MAMIGFGAALLTVAFGSPALALSTVQPAEEPRQDNAPAASPIPLPDITLPRAGGATTDEDTPPETGPSDAVGPGSQDLPSAEIFYGADNLPAPVRTMRELIMQACLRGDVEALRPLLGIGADITQLSLSGLDSDPIEYIKGLSGDEKGHEILAILLEVLEAGYVRMEAGTDQEIYVWPYFAGVAIDTLSAEQRVELFKVITAGDYEDMVAYGAYIFYRVGITPDGKWQYFIAGD